MGHALSEATTIVASVRSKSFPLMSHLAKRCPYRSRLRFLHLGLFLLRSPSTWMTTVLEQSSFLFTAMLD